MEYYHLTQIFRQRVQFQWQKDKNKTTNWIRVQTLDAGTSGPFPKNRGHVFIPELDDQVMIGFEYGDPNRPYMTGSMFPERHAKGGEADNNIKSIKTRSGHITAPETITISAKNIKVNANESIRMSAGEDIIESAGKNKTDTAGETHVTSILICMIIIWGLSFLTSATPTSSVQQKKLYDIHQLLKYSTDENRLPTITLVAEQYKICPPLSPERFRRRVKILWGIDINDYPENATILVTNFSRLSVKYQFFNGEKAHVGNADYLPTIPPLSDSVYSLVRKFLFFADTSVFNRIRDNKYFHAEEALKIHKEFLEEKRYYKEEFNRFYDILSDIYRSTIMPPPILFSYAEENNPITGNGGCELLCNIVAPINLVHPRTFDLKGDLLSFYLDEQSKNRNIWLVRSDTKKEKTDVPVSWRGNSLTNSSDKYGGSLDMFFPWHNYNIARSLAGNLSFLLRFQQKTTNSYVIRFMSGQLDDAHSTMHYLYRERQDSIREQIRSNNYYGYAILREFCENLEREMPTLEKVGSSFSAQVANPKVLLYLEPYPDSYDIDTLFASEIFKVYEMGYDDYYLVEVVKPVESPVAGPDGYAMILDRTETIYGYVRKVEVKEVSEAEIEIQKIKKPFWRSKTWFNKRSGRFCKYSEGTKSRIGNRW